MNKTQFLQKLKDETSHYEMLEAIAACILLSPGGSQTFETEQEEETQFFLTLEELETKTDKDLLKEAIYFGLVHSESPEEDLL